MAQAEYTAEELLQLGRENYEKLVLYCTNLEAQGFWEQARKVMKQSSTDVLDRYVQSVLMTLAVHCGELLENQKEFISLITNTNPFGIEGGEEIDEQTIKDCQRFSTFPPILIQLCGMADSTFGSDSGEYFLDAFLNILLCMSYLNDGKDAEVNRFVGDYYEKIVVFLNEYELFNHMEYLFRKLRNNRISCDVRWLHVQVDKKQPAGTRAYEADSMEDTENAEAEDIIIDEEFPTDDAEESSAEENSVEEKEERTVRIGGMEMQEPPEQVVDEEETSPEGENSSKKPKKKTSKNRKKKSAKNREESALKEESSVEEQKESVDAEENSSISDEEWARIEEEKRLKEEQEEKERQERKARLAKEFAELQKQRERQEAEEAKAQFMLVKQRIKEREEAERQEKEARLQKLVDELNELVGLQGVKTEIQSLINLIRIRKLREQMKMPTMDMSYHMVFTGAPGTGKTTVARIVARIYQELGILSKGTMIETDRSGLVAGYVGQTALKVHELVEEAIGGVLFIDEAYSLVNPDVPNDFGMEAVDTLVKLMEDHRDNLVIIVAGYTQEMKAFLKSNTGLVSRFNKFIDFPNYSDEELLNILDVMAENAGLSIEEKAREAVGEWLETMDAAAKEEFGNARGIRNLFEKIVMKQANRLIQEEEPSKEMLMTIVKEDVLSV